MLILHGNIWSETFTELRVAEESIDMHELDKDNS